MYLLLTGWKAHDRASNVVVGLQAGFKCATPVGVESILPEDLYEGYNKSILKGDSILSAVLVTN